VKKTILYIIDSIDKVAGAELMMIAPLEEIRHRYKVILVTLHPGNAFENYYLGDVQYCLDMKSRVEIFRAALKLKSIIRSENVQLIHSFLYWSGIVARLACNNKTPYVFSLATMMTDHVYHHKWYSRYTQVLDFLTYQKNHLVISPTWEVLHDYNSSVGIKGKSAVLHNFVLDEFFVNQIPNYRKSSGLRLVAVGNIKEVKNYQVVIDAMAILKNYPVSLDIYGFGSLSHAQKKAIKDENLAIRSMGTTNKVFEVLANYDAFIMSSFHEGFGIAAAEAMAIGLPLILSDIGTLREVSENNALFFDPSDSVSLAKILISISELKVDLNSLSERGKKIAKGKYTRQKYVSKLLEVYKVVDTNAFSNPNSITTFPQCVA
jgi:glycosyltransferase involved in cell wall biosynthesis